MCARILRYLPLLLASVLIVGCSKGTMVSGSESMKIYLEDSSHAEFIDFLYD